VPVLHAEVGFTGRRIADRIASAIAQLAIAGA
jgi:hypothetical protein